MPLEIVKMARSSRSKICKEDFYSSPSFGFCASQNMHYIKLEIPMRKNQTNFKKQSYIFRKKRKRIETLFSQLSDQFMIKRNYAKSFNGFKTRIASKITALTIIQYINKFVFDRNINNLKINII